MKTILYFEGQDNCLKTTLIENIRRQFHQPFHVLHYGKPSKVDDQHEYQIKSFEEMFSVIYSNPYNFILDRSHLGEIVWGNIYRNKDLSQEILSMDKNLMDHGCNNVLITLVDTNFEKWKIRDDFKGLNSGKEEIHAEEAKLFNKMHEQSYISKKIFYDLKDHYLAYDENKINSELIEQQILKLIRK